MIEGILIEDAHSGHWAIRVGQHNKYLHPDMSVEVLEDGKWVNSKIVSGSGLAKNRLVLTIGGKQVAEGVKARFKL